MITEKQSLALSLNERVNISAGLALLIEVLMGKAHIGTSDQATIEMITNALNIVEKYKLSGDEMENLVKLVSPPVIQKRGGSSDVGILPS